MCLPSLNQWASQLRRFIRPHCAGWGARAWTCCNLVSNILEAGLDWETDLTSALLSAPRRSGWWMSSNQQQTDLPQETSPHHVYGNQHFSRDPLIASEGEGEGGEKQLDSPSFSVKKISRLSTVHWPEYDLQACCQMTSWTMQRHTAWLTWKQLPITYFGSRWLVDFPLHSV